MIINLFQPQGAPTARAPYGWVNPQLRAATADRRVEGSAFCGDPKRRPGLASSLPGLRSRILAAEPGLGSDS